MRFNTRMNKFEVNLISAATFRLNYFYNEVTKILFPIKVVRKFEADNK